MQQRRTYKRYFVNLPVEVEFNAQTYPAKLTNIGLEGCFLEMEPIFAYETPLRFKFTLGDKPLQARGKVRWSRIRKENQNINPGMGIKFEGLSREQFQLLLTYILYEL